MRWKRRAARPFLCARPQCRGQTPGMRLRASLAPCAARRWKSCWPCALRRRSGNALRRPRRRWPPHCSRVPRATWPRRPHCAPVSRRRSSLPVRKKSGRRLNVCCCLCSTGPACPSRCAPKPGWSCRGQSSRAKASCIACLPRFRARALRVLLRKTWPTLLCRVRGRGWAVLA